MNLQTNNMNNLIKLLLSLLFLTSFSLAFGQEEDSEEEQSDGGEGGQSTAEASVTGAASAPAVSSPGSIESNPVVGALRSGISISAIKSLGIKNLRSLYNSGGFENLVSTLEAVASSTGDVDLDLLSALSAYDKYIKAAALDVSGMSSYTSDYREALTSAAELAGSLLVDRSVTSASDLSTSISVDTFTTGYNVAFVNLLSKYGAIGSNGDSVVADILTGSLSDNLEDNSDLLNKTRTSNYLSYLATYTGSASFGDIDATSSVLDIPVENISITPGANISVGSSSGDSSVDVSTFLGKAASEHRDYRKVHVIGAAKDMKIAGNVTFSNTNDAEDHALVLGAADDFMLDGSDITYTGSNLGLGAGGSDADSMYLVNTNITTGGNLAAGTLGTLNISSANFNVGNGGHDSDPDNVYLYANELIQVNGLNFSGSRLDDVYMEAITINLKNVAFPSTADVILKSRDGTVNFPDTFSNYKVGSVNLTNVSHGGTVLTESHFDGVAGHHDSSIRLPNGTAAVKIRKQY
jgi:hypothetical protein